MRFRLKITSLVVRMVDLVAVLIVSSAGVGGRLRLTVAVALALNLPAW